ncbi:hypothetical protein HZS_5210, partial [Henneguya salminicola]
MGILDIWNDFDTRAVGIYPMNGVFGEYYKSQIYATLSIHLVNDQTKYRTFQFRINKIAWKNLMISKEKSCVFIINKTLTSCKYKLYISIANNILIKHQAGYHNSEKNRYLQYTIGLSEENIFNKNVEIKMALKIYPYSSISSDFIKKKLKFYPQTGQNRFILHGIKDTITIDVSFKFDCRGYAGINCHSSCDQCNSYYDCENNINCNKLNASKSLFLKSCSARNCKNGGKCIILFEEIFCKCKTGYFGPKCDLIKISQLKCYKGKIISQRCVCEDGYFGKECQWNYCDLEKNNFCTNDAICIQHLNETKYCSCYVYTLDFDETYLCPSYCIYTKCVSTNLFAPKLNCVCGSKREGITSISVLIAITIFI